MTDGLRIRLGVHNLSDDQVAQFRAAYREMQAISDNRGYQSLAGLHGAPRFTCRHQQPLFLPWHRAYLYSWEMAMRDRIPGVTLPWWDWTLGPPRQSGIPRIFSERTAAGQPNPLFAFRMNLPNTNPPLNRDTARDPDDPSELPSQTDLDSILTRTDWNDFTEALENLHDGVHGWVGGDMGIVASAAFDPIFWSHHAMIDRVWWLWQVRNGNANMPAELLGAVLSLFNMTVRDVLNVNALGYEYAAAQSVIPIGGGG